MLFNRNSHYRTEGQDVGSTWARRGHDVGMRLKCRAVQGSAGYSRPAIRLVGSKDVSLFQCSLFHGHVATRPGGSHRSGRRGQWD